ncbi:MAG: DUF308 domain-containing protein [Methanospirillum sp.]
MAQPSSTNKWIGVLAGIVAILFGLFAFAMPGVMLVSLVLFFGIFAIIEALILLFGGIMAGSEMASMRWILIAGAVVTLILGVLALWNPTGFVIAIAILIGIWAFVLGLFQIFVGIAGRTAPYWWLTLISGVLGVIVGLYILTQPVAGSVVLIWALGIYAIVFGIERIVLAFSPAPAAAPVAI